MVVVALGATLVACSDDGGSDDDTTTSTAATSTTHPPAAGNEEENAFALAESVVLEASEVVDQLFEDPSLLDDSESDVTQQFYELHTDDSPYVDFLEDFLGDWAEQGWHDRVSEGGSPRRFGLFDPRAMDQDRIQFFFCRAVDVELVSADGEVSEPLREVSAGSLEAHRVDGLWRVHDLKELGSDDESFEAGFTAEINCDRQDYEVFRDVFNLPVARDEDETEE